MTFGVSVSDLRLHFGEVRALDGISFELTGGKIYGLLGRNGSGKTSLLSVLAAFRRQTSGVVRIDGAEPFENPEISGNICLIRESGDFYDDGRARDVLTAARAYRRSWDEAYANRLAERFQLPLRRRVSKLSRGQRSALGIVVGMASRAPVTMFDESYLGLDAPSRYAFYDELLADYAAHPRTYVISTHLIEEVAPLLEEVVIIDRGRLIAQEETETLRSRGTAVTGPAELVDTFAAGLTVLNERRLGGTKSITSYGELTPDQSRAAELAGLELSAVPLQDLFIHLTAPDNPAGAPLEAIR